VKKKLPPLQKLWLNHYVYGDHRYAWLVVHDRCAGRKSVYTVYRIELTGDKGSTVIGRELDLSLAKKIVRQDIATGRSS